MKNSLLITILLFLATFLSAQCIEGDCINGEGTKVYTSGNKYQGAFVNGMREGYGKFIWASGSKYKGEWKENKRHGEGEEFLATGEKYVGKFSQDKKNGGGTFYNADGSIKQQGKWVNGQYSAEPKDPISKLSSKMQTVQEKKSNRKKKSAPKFDKWVNIGLGLNSISGKLDVSFAGIDHAKFPLLFVNPELIQMKNGIKVGPFIGYATEKLTITDFYYNIQGEIKVSNTLFGLRAIYPFQTESNSDFSLYLGAFAGYNVVKLKVSATDFFDTASIGLSGSAFAYQVFGGFRYNFGGLSAFCEAGYGISYANAGLSIKI